MARETGLEPATSGVTGRRSNQLSYSPTGARPDKPRKFASQGWKRSQTLIADPTGRSRADGVKIDL